MKTIDSLLGEIERLQIAINVLAERQVELIDSRQALLDERNVMRADLHRAVNELRTGIWGFAQYLHNIDHEGPILACHRGICPGVRGLLRRTEDAEDTSDTAIYLPVAA